MMVPSLTRRSSDCQPPISKLSIATSPRKPPIYIMMAMACSERNACHEKTGPSGRGRGGVDGATGARGAAGADGALLDGAADAAAGDGARVGDEAAGIAEALAGAAAGARRAVR